ncbi:hypothetical protein WJX72_010162 [[Myrmecia] bisecta]|uniref:Uncharacterized protein n=1 Tax=[Myrmecia] bisecta TaxID=41462 RepID=A0AAW1Q1N9_9CHLO
MRIRVTGSAILPFDSGKQQTLAAGLAGAVTASNFTITKDTVQVTGVYYVTSGRRRLQGSSSQQVDVVVSIDAKQAARMEDLKAAMAAFEQETRRMGLMDVLQYLGVDTSSGDPKKIRKAAFMQLHPDKTALVADPLERIRRTEGFKLAIAKGLQKL